MEQHAQPRVRPEADRNTVMRTFACIKSHGRFVNEFIHHSMPRCHSADLRNL
jgi:hypothetical protein